MTALNASAVPVAVRIRNARYDGMVTGYLHGAPTFTKTDPGGFRAGSFVVDQRLGFRSDMIQPYSRVYFYDKLGGSTLFEGDVSHPGRSISTDGALLEVQVQGGAERLTDWAGMRIYTDRDMTAWTKLMSTSIASTTVDAGENKNGAGTEALTLSFGLNVHVENGYKAEAIYTRIRESGQTLGWFNYAWDAGVTNASWRVHSMVTPPSTTVRDQAANTSGSGASGAVVGGSIPVGAQWAFLQLEWTSSGSNTGDNDVVWVSYMTPIIVARLVMKDGSFKTGASYSDTITCFDVVNDLLGDQLAESFDGPGATVETGAGYQIKQLAYPNGVNPLTVLEDCLQFEPGMTYTVGPSSASNDKYSFSWATRSEAVRYEFVLWTDAHSNGVQPTDQYNAAVTRWQTPAGRISQSVTTQTIPEMDAVGRTRRYFQDLGNESGDLDNATQVNLTALEEHRYPANGGQVTVSRAVVDLFTGRRVEPYEIEPGYLCRLVGIDPSPDALNATAPDGGTVCRIVATNYSADSHSVSLELDSVPWSLFRAIAYASKRTRQRRLAGLPA